MTNIAAFTVSVPRKGGKEEKYIVVQTESQASSVGGDRKDSTRQKLRRVGPNVVMGSGRGDYIRQVVSEAAKADGNQLAKDLAESVWKITESKHYQDGTGLDFIIAGPDKDGLAVYHVIADVPEKSPYKRTFLGPQDAAYSGSGARMVGPAIERDYEMGYMVNLNDLAEGVAYCWNLADRAQTDSFVNDRLQIGLVASDHTRTLFHPRTRFDSLGEYLDYLNLNLGLTLKDAENTGPFKGLMNDLYHAMEVSALSMLDADYTSNRTYTEAKVAKPSKRKKYGKDAQKNLKYRDAEKRHVQRLVDAWNKGDMDEIDKRLNEFDARRQKSRRKALRTRNTVSGTKKRKPRPKPKAK